MSLSPPLPPKTKSLVDETEKRVTSEDVDILERVTSVKERRKHHTTIISAWRQQQVQDREMRRQYATWLMIVLSGQIIAINVLFRFLGLGWVKYEPWTANTFIMAVFAEIGAMILLIVKYLFPPTADKILDLIDRFRDHEK